MRVTDRMIKGAEHYLQQLHGMVDCDGIFVVSIDKVVEKQTACGKPMGVMEVSDNTGVCEAIVFPSLWSKHHRTSIFAGAVSRLECSVERLESGAYRLIVIDAWPYVAGTFEEV